MNSSKVVNTNLVEGRQPVIELINSGQEVNQLYIAKGERHGLIRKIIIMAKNSHIVIKEVERSYLNSLSQTGNHQGVIARISPIKYLTLDELLSLGKPPLYLVLAGIQDPHNLGSLIRSAEVCGVSAVIIPKRRAAAVTTAVIKASSGAVSYMPICRVANINSAVKRLKDEGLWVVGGDMDGEICYAQDLSGPLALVIGGEGKGLPRLVKENCDLLVKIPLLGRVNSLNAAVAGAILMYEIVRQKNVSL